jgi:hypothetical protein
MAHTEDPSRAGRDSYKLALRLPHAFRDALHELAERHGRSVNSEIVSAVRWHIIRHTSDEEDARRELLGLVQQFVDIVEFEREERGYTYHLSSDGGA